MADTCAHDVVKPSLSTNPRVAVVMEWSCVRCRLQFIPRKLSRFKQWREVRRFRNSIPDHFVVVDNKKTMPCVQCGTPIPKGRRLYCPKCQTR